MKLKQSESEDDADWAAAQAALSAAQKMPSGPERIEALRKAGQLRFEADKRRRQLQERTNGQSPERSP
jgi:hypothetical protein